MSLESLLTTSLAADAHSNKASAVHELEDIFPPTDWGVEVDVNQYSSDNVANLWNNELRKPVRRTIEEAGKGSTEFSEWLGEIQFVNITVFSKRLFQPAHRSNAGWRITIFSLPRVDAVIAALSSHYQNAQNHNKLGEVSNLLFDVINDSSTATDISGRKISAVDWDRDGLISPPIDAIAGVPIAPNLLTLKDVRTTTVKKTLASFITLNLVPRSASGTRADALKDALLRLKVLAESLLDGVYPFSTLEDFENFRSLALQDTAAAQARLQLRGSNHSRSTMRIYYGPPGTGKTLSAVRLAVSLADPNFSSSADTQSAFSRFNELNSQCAFVTFHPSLQYEDLVESIRPAIANDEQLGEDLEGESEELKAKTSKGLAYRLHEGPLLRLIRRALLEPNKEFVIVIDEINRGDISRILGPLISSLDVDKRLGAKFPIGIELMYPRVGSLESRLFLPSNLHVVGTMNSADRNIALVDHALRRRFEFIEVPATPELLAANSGKLTIDRRRLLAAINARVAHLLDTDHCIGHGYLMSCDDDEAVVAACAKNIIPLLREYFYGNEGLVRLVLGEFTGGASLIFAPETGHGEFAALFGVDEDAAAEWGYRPGTGGTSLRYDGRFWSTGALVAAPGDLSYAIGCVKKIYATFAELSEEAAPLPDGQAGSVG